jgi:hypothetical protein
VKVGSQLLLLITKLEKPQFFHPLRSSLYAASTWFWMIKQAKNYWETIMGTNLGDIKVIFVRFMHHAFFFFFEQAKRIRAIAFGLIPSSQATSQNRNFFQTLNSYFCWWRFGSWEVLPLF